jgi:hypothetical protein
MFLNQGIDSGVAQFFGFGKVGTGFFVLLELQLADPLRR